MLIIKLEEDSWFGSALFPEKLHPIHFIKARTAVLTSLKFASKYIASNSISSVHLSAPPQIVLSNRSRPPRCVVALQLFVEIRKSVVKMG
ncbi:hypothetical protein RRG08_020502 [Elysia crispata]|uniref:Uncharacterized protein n=1 Tax=Elysia crispata TaxID=231223 RepID=A0AAE0YY15_9GAST|nr:hypothetical protein RRG08_020502 [Elysia crispata]